MNMRKLKGRIVENDFSICGVAKSIGISHSALYRKFKQPESFTIGEVIKIKELISLSNEEAIEIFLK